MTKITLAAFLVSTLLLSSCAEMVVKNYAPKRGGTVRYSNGFLFAGKNRDKAIEEMTNYCAPSKAKLMAENTTKEFTGISQSSTTKNKNSYDTTSHASSEKYVYLHFRCLDAKTSASK